MFNIAIATYKRNRTIIKRAFPWSFIFGRFIGGTFVVVFPYFIFTYFSNGNLSESFSQYTQQSDYITYIVLGASIHVLGKSTLMNIGRSLITEMREGTLQSFLISPASRNGYFLGCSIEQLGRSCFEFGIILIVGFILGAQLERIFTLQALLVLIIAIISFFSIAATLSSVMLYTRDTYITQNTLFIFMSLVCGIAFPIEYLPKWLQIISHIFPMTAAVKLFRAVVMINESIFDNLHLVYEIGFLSIIYIFIGMFWLAKIEKKLLEEIFA